MLQINVSQQLKASVGTTREYSIEDMIDVTGGGDGKNKVRGSISLLRTDRGILVKGTLHTDVELTCSRCLSLFPQSLAVDIEDEYLPTIDVYTGNNLPLPDAETFTIDEHNILNLAEAVRQYALTAIPMKPLCRPDCKGLCPVCGGNLNQGACRCFPKPPDPRWAKLNQLTMASNQTSAKDQKGME
ncbi:MAG: DUF177 domain-containing protein [Chloroflexi bacterium]|nr:DUF177 domain-containing protein [Chloroflexota bacterium]